MAALTLPSGRAYRAAASPQATGGAPQSRPGWGPAQAGRRARWPVTQPGARRGPPAAAGHGAAPMPAAGREGLQAARGHGRPRAASRRSPRWPAASAYRAGARRPAGWPAGGGTGGPGLLARPSGRAGPRPARRPARRSSPAGRTCAPPAGSPAPRTPLPRPAPIRQKASVGDDERGRLGLHQAGRAGADDHQQRARRHRRPARTRRPRRAARCRPRSPATTPAARPAGVERPHRAGVAAAGRNRETGAAQTWSAAAYATPARPRTRAPPRRGSGKLATVCAAADEDSRLRQGHRSPDTQQRLSTTSTAGLYNSRMRGST